MTGRTHNERVVAATAAQPKQQRGSTRPRNAGCRYLYRWKLAIILAPSEHFGLQLMAHANEWQRMMLELSFASRRQLSRTEARAIAKYLTEVGYYDTLMQWKLATAQALSLHLWPANEAPPHLDEGPQIAHISEFWMPVERRILLARRASAAFAKAQAEDVPKLHALGIDVYWLEVNLGVCHCHDGLPQLLLRKEGS